jgi:hypothetical protein
MLTLSKRTIISEKVLKISPGPFVKVRASEYPINTKRSPYGRQMSLLQGTRVPLQYLNCSAEKFKGTNRTVAHQ